MTEGPDFAPALDEARRKFDSLNARLADLRNRSLQLVSVGGLAASLVGGLSTLQKDGLGVWEVVALAAFALIVGICIWLWLPRRIWASHSPADLVAWAELRALTRQDINRNLALHMHNHADKTRRSSIGCWSGFVCHHLAGGGGSSAWLSAYGSADGQSEVTTAAASAAEAATATDLPDPGEKEWRDRPPKPPRTR